MHRHQVGISGKLAARLTFCANATTFVAFTSKNMAEKGSESESVFDMASSVRGCHVFHTIWTPEIGQTLSCDHEHGNPEDKFVVACIFNGMMKMCHKKATEEPCPGRGMSGFTQGRMSYTAKGNMWTPSMEECLKWIKEAWDLITPQVFQKSFKKTGISNAVDGTENDLFAAADDVPFDFVGFKASEPEDAEEFVANVSSSIDGSCPSEEEDETSDSNESPDSSGH